MQKEPYDTSRDFLSKPFEVHEFMRVLDQPSGRLADDVFAPESEKDWTLFGKRRGLLHKPNQPRGIVRDAVSGS